jgi:hypothetical protein
MIKKVCSSKKNLPSKISDKNPLAFELTPNLAQLKAIFRREAIPVGMYPQANGTILEAL